MHTPSWKRQLLVFMAFLAISPVAPSLTVFAQPTATDTPETSTATLATVQIRAVLTAYLNDMPHPDQPESLRLGTATIVDASKGLLLTAFHVVDSEKPSSGIRTHLTAVNSDPQNDGSYREEFSGIYRVYRIDNGVFDYWYNAELVDWDEQHDLAILQIRSTAEGLPVPQRELDALPSIPPSGTATVSATDSVVVLGYPIDSPNAGDTLETTTGHVRSVLEDKIRADVNTQAGMSGGAVVNERGELIAVHIGISAEESIALFVPIHFAIDLLTPSATDPPDREPDLSWGPGFIFLGWDKHHPENFGDGWYTDQIVQVSDQYEDMIVSVNFGQLQPLTAISPADIRVELTIEAEQGTHSCGISIQGNGTWVLVIDGYVREPMSGEKFPWDGTGRDNSFLVALRESTDEGLTQLSFSLNGVERGPYDCPTSEDLPLSVYLAVTATEGTMLSYNTFEVWLLDEME